MGVPSFPLADHYLRDYLAYGGAPVSLGQLLREIHVLWCAWTVRHLDMWLEPAQMGNPAIRDLLNKKIHFLRLACAS